MKTIAEYLSGQFDEELRVLVAEARGWKFSRYSDMLAWYNPSGIMTWCREVAGLKREPKPTNSIPLYSTSLDACRELLEDLTEEEWIVFTEKLFDVVALSDKAKNPYKALFLATARQICVAWLITKGILK